MCIERTLLRVTLLTKFTNEGPLSGMLSHVIVEIALSPGSVVTSSAFEGLFPGMDSHMNFDALFLCETLPANLAVVWSLTSMSPECSIKTIIYATPSLMNLIVTWQTLIY